MTDRGVPRLRELSAAVPRTQRRVLVLLNQLSLGGTPLNALDFAGAVRRHGYDSVLVAEPDRCASDRLLLPIAEQRGFPVTVLPAARTTAARARLLEDFARENRCDLLHTYGWWSASPSFWGPARFGSRPLVLTAYEMSTQPQIFPWLPLVVGTQYQMEDLSARPGRVHFISPPVDLALDNAATVDAGPFMRRTSLDPSHVRLVVVSRLAEEMKAPGIETAMRAVQRLGRGDVDLIVVGAGDAELRLRWIAQEVNGTLGRDAVVMPGAMADPRPAYACADVVLGMGGSAARGLAFGKPLVALGEAGWSGAFTPESAEAVFRRSFWSSERVPQPVDMMVAELRPLLEEPRRRDALGAFGRAFAEDNFGVDAMGSRLASVYDQAMSDRRRLAWIQNAVRYAEPARISDFVRRRVTRVPVACEGPTRDEDRGGVAMGGPR